MRLLTLIVLLAAMPALPQSATYRVAGTVVSSLDGNPIQHATIDLVDPSAPAGAATLTTTSDELGRFSFSSVPPGNRILKGEAPGYLSTQYEQHQSSFSTGIVSAPGIDAESLVLKLLPESIISGIIRDQSNDPVANAILHLFRQDFASRPDTSEGIATSDDRGRFEFPRLQPGNYYIAVVARPWYATYPELTPTEPDASASASDHSRQPGIAAYIDPALDVAYPVTFYPGTTYPTAAEPIYLRGGDSPDVSFNLATVPAVSLSVPAQSAGHPYQPLELGVFFHGHNLPIEPVLRESDKQIQYLGLAPGDYSLNRSHFLPAKLVLSASIPGMTIVPPAPDGAFRLAERGDDAGLTSNSIHVGADNSASDQPSSGLAYVHIALHAADGSTLPPSLRVALTRSHHPEQFTIASVDAKGALTLAAAPGDYYLEVALPNGRLIFIRSVVSGDKPLPANHIHLSADENVSLSLVVARGTHSLTGIVQMDGKPRPGAFVMIFSSGVPIDEASYVCDQTNLDGSFELDSLAPGTYTLLAVDDVWDLDMHDPVVLAPYLRNALTVHIPEGGRRTYPLPHPLTAQSRRTVS